MFKIIKIKKPSYPLDFGCNEGTGTEKIAKITNSKMFGVDSNIIAMKKPKKKKLNISFLSTNKNQLPFNNNYFDFVTVIHVIGHLIEPKKYDNY